MSDPLAFTSFEMAWGASMLIGVVLAVVLVASAARSRLRWTPAVVAAVLALFLPFIGPALALLFLLHGQQLVMWQKASDA